METVYLALLSCLGTIAVFLLGWLAQQRGLIKALLRQYTPAELQDMLERAADIAFDAVEQIRRKAESLSAEELRDLAYPIMLALLRYLGAPTANEDVLRGTLEARIWKENRSKPAVPPIMSKPLPPA
jgi:hypothetical protein